MVASAADPTPDSPPPPERDYTPLFHAFNAERYSRQEMIRAYEEAYDCRVIVMKDAIFPYSVTFFEELLHDAVRDKPLHLILSTPGGDGETAVRLVRAAQARCTEFVVIVPDQAKSAGTLLSLGAHGIMMSATSDLGPVDPQMRLRDGGPLVAAKDIIAAVENAAAAVEAAPDTYPLHASLLADVNAIIVQQARSALGRTDELLQKALESMPERSPAEATALASALHRALVEEAQSHGALFGLTEAKAAGLPVIEKAPDDPQWRAIWRLWTRYFSLDGAVYESRRASQLLPG